VLEYTVLRSTIDKVDDIGIVAESNYPCVGDNFRQKKHRPTDAILHPRVRPMTMQAMHEHDTEPEQVIRMVPKCGFHRSLGLNRLHAFAENLASNGMGRCR
jgi:hypothetical protein